MTSHYRWPDMRLDTSEFLSEVARFERPYLRDIVEVVYRNHLARERKVRWGDKTPGYIEIVPQLASLFPGAQFIHLFRDGHDVAKSFQVLRWQGGGWLHASTQEWNKAADFDETWRRTEFASAILQLRYEDLVLKTEETVVGICNFLNEPFDPQMLLWHEKVDDLVPAREAHIHQKLKHAPKQSDVYRWKREMTAREIFVSEAFMGRHLRRLGYECRYQSRAWESVFGLTRLFCRFVLPAVMIPIRLLRRLRRLMGIYSERPVRTRNGVQ